MTVRTDGPTTAIAWAWPLRALVALLILAMLGASAAWFEHAPLWLRLHTPQLPAMGHAEAAARQQGQPTTASESLAAIDHDLIIAQARAAAPSPGWGDESAVGDLLVARARLTGSFDDYAAAGRAFDSAFALAPNGSGPHLERAGWNFAVHRLAAIEPDLVAVDNYAIPDDGMVVAMTGLRGDILFYRGHYAQALTLYQQAQARMPTMGGDLKLANWYARMGDPDRALQLLDEADGRITAPQQQLRSFIEMRRGILDLNRGRWDEAEAHLRRADDIFPGYWLVEEQLATVRALKGDPAGAMAIFRRMAQQYQLPDAYDGIAGLYRAQGDFANAQIWAAKAGVLWDQRLKLLPEAALGHALDHLLAFGDPQQALAVAQRNYALRPYGDSATGLAAAFLANHRAAEALAALAPTFASGWVSAEPHIIASEAHALLGQGAEADAERAAALAINPHSLDRNPGMTWLEQ
jgi:tetratricopeptide (TPR) repeat protein